MSEVTKVLYTARGIYEADFNAPHYLLEGFMSLVIGTLLKSRGF